MFSNEEELKILVNFEKSLKKILFGRILLKESPANKWTLPQAIISSASQTKEYLIWFWKKPD